jgi:hypothetical protein
MTTGSKSHPNRSISLKMDDDYLDFRLLLKLPKLRLRWLLAPLGVLLVWLLPNLADYIKLFLTLVGK